MRFAIIIALFVVLGLFLAERSLPAHAECLGTADSCLVLPLNNPIYMKLLFPLFSHHKGHITVTLFCEVRNPSDTLQPIDVNQFSLASADGIHFKSFIKKKNLVDSLSTEWVPPGAHEDHVIQFISTEKYSRKEGDKLIKASRFYLLQHQEGKADSLFVVLYGHGEKTNPVPAPKDAR